MQPEVDAPVTIRLSQPSAARNEERAVPWNAEAKSLVSTGSSSRGATRGSISTQRLPASSVSRAGTLSMKAAAVLRSASV
jgi:hypothetical protein